MVNFQEPESCPTARADPQAPAYTPAPDVQSGKCSVSRKKTYKKRFNPDVIKQLIRERGGGGRVVGIHKVTL